MRTSDRERKIGRGLTLCLASVAMIAASLCCRAGAEETGADQGPEPYDFYANTKYPGAKLRPDVELYKVKQAGNGDPLAYERREVVWWPRKGVDIIEVKEGMPLRTWTSRPDPHQEWSAPQQFEAHLVGFRGMGNTMSSKYGGDGGPREPAVVLRLPDGRKRCFPTGYEVTQRQFYKLMMPKDYDYEAWQYKRGPLTHGAAFHFRKRPGGIIFNDNAVGGPLTDLNPMECITWARASEFCRKVTETERKAGRLPDGYVYRLPSEAEWEYACRAGTKGPYNVDVDHSDIKNLKRFAFYGGANWWVSYTSEVGNRRLPNAWGLYDMHGNVYEWCHDWYGPYEKGEVADPLGPAEGKEKVARGGCFYLKDENVHAFLRSGSRYCLPPDIEFNAIVGMRLALAPAIE